MSAIDRIVDLAKKRGFTQAAVERAVGLSENRISKWKNGDGEPTLRQAARIAVLLGTTVDYLANEAAKESLAINELTAEERLIIDLLRGVRDPAALREALREIAALLGRLNGEPTWPEIGLPAGKLTHGQIEEDKKRGKPGGPKKGA